MQDKKVLLEMKDRLRKDIKFYKNKIHYDKDTLNNKIIMRKQLKTQHQQTNL